MMSPDDFADLQRVLSRSRSVCDSAEAHGTLTGALCSAAPCSLDDWLGEILPEGNAAPEERRRLQDVYQRTRAALAGTDFAFQPLLPPEADSLVERTAALGEWVQGFLYGLGLAGAPDLAQRDAELTELLRDLTEITRVSVEAGEADEAAEEAYAELVEYVRVGVQLFFDRLAPLRPAAPPASTLH
ncbi:MAG: hypothetical protein RL026_1801 [Pseudomonadota bacterium]|jgi:yecA family protein